MTKKTSTKAPKTHPADIAGLAQIPSCTAFFASLLVNKKQEKAPVTKTLDEARKAGAALAAKAKNGKLPLVYAMPAKGPAILVPDTYVLPSPVKDEAAKAAAIREGIKADRVAPKGAPAKGKAPKAKAAKAEPAPKAAKAEPAPKAAKAAKAPKAKKAAKSGPSKTDIVIKMLTAKGGTTRAAIVEATEWNVDLKQLCARKGMKLKKSADGILTATAPKE